MRVRSGLRDDGATVAVCDQDAGAWLQVEDPLCRGDIVLRQGQWLLNGAAVIAARAKALRPAEHEKAGAVVEHGIAHRLELHRVEGLRSSQLGSKSIDSALNHFADHWHYGMNKMVKKVDMTGEALLAAGQRYTDVDAKIAAVTQQLQ